MIGSVVHKGTQILVYDEKGHQIANVYCADGELKGYTSRTFSVKKGTQMLVYDEKGHQISNTYCY